MGVRIPLLPAAAIGFCGVGLVTAFAGLRQATGAGSTAKLWLVLFVAAGIAALVLLRTARDDRGRVRLGVGWAVLGAVIVGVTVDRTPGAGPGVPISSGWAVLVAGGIAVLVGGLLLALSPVLRVSANRVIVALVVVVVCAIQAGGYAGAVSWTDGQNVNLSVADAAPLPVRRVALDGRMAWSSTVTGLAVASAGGVLTTLANGVQMLDPGTGKPRWTYRRADLSTVYDPVASSDHTEVAAIGLEGSPDTEREAGGPRRLMVFNAMTGAVITDTLLDAHVQGALATLGANEAYFAGSPDGIRTVQVGGVKLTGPQAGKPGWVYVPKDHCELGGLSARGTDLALSTTCGTLTMLNPDGTARWTFHAPEGGVQLWPLGPAPAGTMEALTEPGPVSNSFGHGISVPSAVVSLDVRTGAVRWRAALPKAPFAPDSPDAANGTMATIWAGGTATLVYELSQSQKVWLVGVRGPAAGQVWSTILPNLAYTSSDEGGSVGGFVAATPDGRIMLPAQNPVSGSDLHAHPTVLVVNSNDGSVTPDIVINGSQGVGGQVGFFGAPSALPTPGGVVLEIPGLAPTGPFGQKFLLIGLH